MSLNHIPDDRPGHHTDEALGQHLRQALRQSETEIDQIAAIRLRAARARALDAARPQRPVWLWAVPATTAATAVLVAALWLPGTPVTAPSTLAPAESVAMEALDVLADEQGPEFYQNLELYEWLEQEGPRA